MSDYEKLLAACVEYRAKLDKLERENATLLGLLSQWLKMADDCHAEQLEVGYSEYNVTVGLLVDTRAAIDAAREEEQP